MPFWKKAPIHIDRDAPLLIGLLGLDQFFSLSRLCKPEVFIGHHLGNGKAVVDLGHVDILSSNTGHLIGLFSCSLGHGQTWKKISSCQIHGGRCGAQPEDPDRLLGKGLSLLFVGNNNAGASIRVCTTVSNSERVCNRIRHRALRIRKHIKGDRLAVNSLLIDLTVSGRLYPDQGQILKGCAVLFHMASGIHGVIGRHHSAKWALPLDVRAPPHPLLWFCRRYLWHLLKADNSNHIMKPGLY